MARWKLRCPECRETFITRDLDSACPNPRCRWKPEKADDGVIDIPMPFLKTSGKTAQIDKLYRDMEKGSEIRMQAASEMLGVPTAEVSGLKMTNMLDGRRQGESSAPSVAVEQSRLEAAGGKVQFMPNGAEYAAQVKTGPHPNAGARMLSSLQKLTGRG